MMPAKDVTIEQVIGTGWAVAYRTGDPRTNAVAVALPPYASDELAEAWQARLVTTLDGYCPQCGAVADTPAEMKTHPEASHVLPNAVRHEQACPLGDKRLDALERACAPGGHIAMVDASAAAARMLADHLAAIARIPLRPDPD